LIDVFLLYKIINVIFNEYAGEILWFKV